jgi:hypothetical protein
MPEGVLREEDPRQAPPQLADIGPAPLQEGN